jgi:hypothetical protein
MSPLKTIVAAMDKSMPRVTSTISIPMDMMPNIALFLSIPLMALPVINVGVSQVANTTSIRHAMTSPNDLSFTIFLISETNMFESLFVFASFVLLVIINLPY